ncbi:MAG: cobalamin-binding protein [Porticoccaceae bacterium]
MLLRLLAAFFIFIAQNSMGAIEVVDDNGDKLKLADVAQRIISLSPNTTEILFHIGAGEKIVGADEYSNYPKQANDILRVNNHAAANYELILSLKPDVVIAWQSGNGEKIISRIRELGIPVFVVETGNLQDIPYLYRRLGQLSGYEKQSNIQAEKFSSGLSQLRKTYSSREEIRLFYQIWNEPLMTLNGDHMVTDIIELCGGVNIFSDAAALVPYVNIESVLAADPQVIITGGKSKSDLLDSGFWDKWPSLSAVKNQHLYAIPSDLLQRHSDRMLEGTGLMCEYIDLVRSTKPQKIERN